MAVLQTFGFVVLALFAYTLVGVVCAIGYSLIMEQRRPGPPESRKIMLLLVGWPVFLPIVLAAIAITMLAIAATRATSRLGLGKSDFQRRLAREFAEAERRRLRVGMVEWSCRCGSFNRVGDASWPGLCRNPACRRTFGEGASGIGLHMGTEHEHHALVREIAS